LSHYGNDALIQILATVCFPLTVGECDTCHSTAITYVLVQQLHFTFT